MNFVSDLSYIQNKPFTHTIEETYSFTKLEPEFMRSLAFIEENSPEKA